MIISQSPLREKLTALIRESKDWQDTSRSIEAISNARKNEVGRTSQDCFGYVFGKNSACVDLLYDVMKLLDTKLHTKFETGDDVIIYFRGDHVAHVGYVESANLVRSKWGMGPIFVHSISDVPSAYGDTVFFTTKTAYLACVKDYQSRS